MTKRRVGYDIETLSNLFTVTFVDISTKETAQFAMHSLRNDYTALCEYLKDVEEMIGYNNIDFDYPVLHPFVTQDHSHETGDILAKKIYKRAQSVIREDWKKDYTREEIIIRQTDIYRIWHFNNKARATSLKYLQINMGWKNVAEMPIDHKSKVTTMEQIDTVLEYNLNDVLSTIEFYNRSSAQIKMRRDLGERYGIDFSNSSDTSIGSKIFITEMSKKTGIPEKTLERGKTFRKNIFLNQCILPSISFKQKEFQGVLDYFRGLVIQDTRSKNNISCLFDGVKYDFGFGGLHALRAPGKYENIESADVSSYYPNLAIKYGFYPYHLSTAFCEVYEHLYEERKKYPKASTESTAIKLALNGVYGMSNAEWSAFYDPAYTMSITMNGQFLLAKLCENITVFKAGRIIMANTDGIEVEVLNKQVFDKICKIWQENTKLTLEFSTFATLAIRDVNNYTGIKLNGEVKEKGDYVCERDIYKDQSMRIVTQAVREFFKSKTPVSRTIRDCKDISLFMMGKRAKTGNLEYRAVDGCDLSVKQLPKNVRYYISRSGGSIVKSLAGNRIVNVHAGYRATMFNKWIEKPSFDDYDVFHTFYEREAMKLIDSIVTQNLKISYEEREGT